MLTKQVNRRKALGKQTTEVFSCRKCDGQKQKARGKQKTKLLSCLRNRYHRRSEKKKKNRATDVPETGDHKRSEQKKAQGKQITELPVDN